VPGRGGLFGDADLCPKLLESPHVGVELREALLDRGEQREPPLVLVGALRAQLLETLFELEGLPFEAGHVRGE
jgi:hypothetical protein